MFKEPVEVLPNVNYTACATLKGPDSHYGTKGLRKVTHSAYSGAKTCFTFCYAAGNNNGTSVEDGQIQSHLLHLGHWPVPPAQAGRLASLLCLPPTLLPHRARRAPLRAVSWLPIPR
uniref:PHR domain-containing protein n=1 Tax=Bos mutus grunniens TaxID=30521 RepID=A0A8B9Y738_BOSMU